MTVENENVDATNKERMSATIENAIEKERRSRFESRRLRKVGERDRENTRKEHE